jgi:hypothetical protein
MHILENVPDFWHMFRPWLFLLVGVALALALTGIVIAKKSKKTWDHPAVTIVFIIALCCGLFGSGAVASYLAPKPVERAAIQLQKEADEQYGISLTKIEAQKMVDPESYNTMSVKECKYSSNTGSYQSECNNVFQDQANPDSNYHRFGHVQIAAVKGEKVTLTTIELVRINNEYRLAYYGKNSEKNTIRELPHL